jgi:hypothetical protein
VAVEERSRSDLIGAALRLARLTIAWKVAEGC